MDEITIYTQNLPSNIEDISKFVLIGREKLASVRAEIRAINKLQIAEEVRNQKKEEAQLLAEALLDAEVRLGELFQQLPKDKSFRGNQYKSASNNSVTSKNASDTDVDSKMISDSNVDNQSKEWQSDTSVDLPKRQIIENLGFNQKQAERFETLAKNKDLVEQVKQEARENDDIATRSQVLSLAKARKKLQEQKEEELAIFCKRSERGKKLHSKLIDTLGYINKLNNEDISDCMIILDDTLAIDILERLKQAKIKIALLEQEAKKYKGVILWQEN